MNVEADYKILFSVDTFSGNLCLSGVHKELLRDKLSIDKQAVAIGNISGI